MSSVINEDKCAICQKFFMYDMDCRTGEVCKLTECDCDKTMAKMIKENMRLKKKLKILEKNIKKL